MTTTTTGPTVTHWCPEEPDQAACDAESGGFITLNPAKVTCPGCLAVIGEEDTPPAGIAALIAEDQSLGRPHPPVNRGPIVLPVTHTGTDDGQGRTHLGLREDCWHPDCEWAEAEEGKRS